MRRTLPFCLLTGADKSNEVGACTTNLVRIACWASFAVWTSSAGCPANVTLVCRAIECNTPPQYWTLLEVYLKSVRRRVGRLTINNIRRAMLRCGNIERAAEFEGFDCAN